MNVEVLWVVSVILNVVVLIINAVVITTSLNKLYDRLGVLTTNYGKVFDLFCLVDQLREKIDLLLKKTNSLVKGVSAGITVKLK